MEEVKEGLEPQKTSAGAPAPEAGTVTLSQTEIEDLKRKAEVSSQNFERAKKAEAKLKELELQNVQTPTEEIEEVFSDEGKLLKKEIGTIKQTVSSLEKSLLIERLLAGDARLRDNRQDFEEFLADPENVSLSPTKASKLFLLEKGLIQTEPERKGLERPSGGVRTPTPSGISVDDVRRLRETNYKEYERRVVSGEIKPEDIK